MADLSGRSSRNSSTFVSAYRFDPFRRFIVVWLLPAVALLTLGAFLLLGWKLHGLASSRALMPEEGARARALSLAFAGLGALISLPLFWLARHLRRTIFETTYTCDDWELVRRTGSHETRVRWDQVTAVEPRALGRLQEATVKTSEGKIRFDGTVIPAEEPRPRLRWTPKGEVIEYPDGRQRPMDIRQNELYLLILEKTGRAP